MANFFFKRVRAQFIISKWLVYLWLYGIICIVYNIMSINISYMYNLLYVYVQVLLYSIIYYI